MRKVFLDDLPKYKNGNVDWKNSIGRKIPFIYNDISGELDLLFVDKEKNRLLIRWNGEEGYINKSNLHKGRIGKIFKITTIESKRKFFVGERIINCKNNIEITKI